MKFRLAAKEDTPAIKELWEYTFDEGAPYFNWYFENVYRDKSTLCCLEGEEIVACLQFAPYDIMLRNSPIRANFIVGLITKAGARGKGYGKALMKEALDTLATIHSPICLLKPLAPEFYRKGGFEYCYNELKWHMPMENLTPLANPSGLWRPVKPEVDIPLLNDIYLQMMCGQNAYTLRNENNWQYILNELKSENGLAWIMEENGRPEAYALYYLDKEKKVFETREIAYTSPKAQKDAFSFVAGHKNQLSVFSWKSTPADISFLELSQNNAAAFSPSVMGRLVSLTEALAAISYPLGENSLIMEIKDAYAPWNSKKWKLEVEDLKGSVSPAKEEENPEISMDISALTAIVFGYLTPWQLAKGGRLEGSPLAISRLERLFPPCLNYMGQYT